MSKPIGQYEVDWSNPLTRSLDVGWYPDNPGFINDLVKNSDGEISVATYLGTQGFAFRKTDKTNTYIRNLTPSSLPAHTDNFTITTKFRSFSYVALASIFGFGKQLPTSTGTGEGRYLIQFNNNYYYWGIGSDWDTGISFDIDGEDHIISLVRDGGNMFFYRDGVLAASTTTPTINSTTNTIFAGGCHSSAATSGDFDFLLGNIHSRALTAEEIALLHSDPYQILREVRTIQDSAYAALFSADSAAYIPKLRLTSGGLVDVDYTGIRLASGGLIEGSPAAAGSDVTLISDSLSISESTLTIQADSDIALVADAISLTADTLSITAESVINLIAESMVVSSGTLGVQVGGTITLLPASLSLTEATLDILTADKTIVLISDSISITEGTMSILNITLTEGDLVAIANAVYAKFVAEGYDPAYSKEMWQLMGLDTSNPVTTTQTDADVDTIHQDITGDGVNTSTITRTS